ncbi:xaa-Pro dipeptidase [Neocloeon triangulifer]|uniref:xaa-Pro dipeptidase n=1 Tax=Neocloeon triangulifer TaxID=2078957 RepID=UPI00286F88FA|nr:xaa-Pro dipeptidase [Neocloeon triangulifer]
MAGNNIRPVYEKGQHTLAVPMTMFAENRARLLARLRAAAGVTGASVVLLQGGDTHNVYCTDAEEVFRQESFFHWAFGVLEPGFYGAIVVGSGETILFAPRLPEDYDVVMGPIASNDEWRQRYAVDRVHNTDEVSQVLRSLNPDHLLLLNGLNSDSRLTCRQAAFDGIHEFTTNTETLHPEISECRVQKSPMELEVMRYVARASSEAHVSVMRRARPGMFEYQCEAEFQRHVYFNGGCRHCAYTCICGTGTNSAVLHYGHAGAPNSRQIQDGDMCLFDMGAQYYCYASDITCSFPANGKFTDDQKMIYNAVLRANRAVIAAMRPGVSWVEMHRLANREMLLAMIEGGVLQGNIDEMMEVNLAATFQPHGLGHLLGCDVHDVGGYLSHCPPRPEQPGFRSLRTARNLEANMVVTVEPGCYFIPRLLEEALADPRRNRFLVREAIERLRGFGGVRIEDDVAVTETGAEILSIVPRTVEEIEQVMAAGRQEEEVVLPQDLVTKPGH